MYEAENDPAYKAYFSADNTSRNASASSSRPQSSDGMMSGVEDSSVPAKPSKFRFKDESQHRSRSSKDRDEEPKRRHRERRVEEIFGDESRARSSSKRKFDENSTRGHRRRGHVEAEKTHRSKRSKESHEHNEPEGKFEHEQGLDPETMFRESLFDAMADDEGAAFWEGVYGAPIPPVPTKEDPITGELERMTEDEYAEYVRMEMWKKTNQAKLEEMERRRAKREEDKKRTDEEKRTLREQMEFQRKMDESLRKGRERKERAANGAAWKSKWDVYEKTWESLRTNPETSTKIPWPIYSGFMRDVNKGNIELFLVNAPTSGRPNRAELAKVLKAERVRWHPDKMQQRLGKLDDNVLKKVIEVFQIVDWLWTENKQYA